MTAKRPLTYRDAGVNIDAGAALIERIKPAATRTRRRGVLAGLGGFGALFELPLDRYRQPILVAGTDGVGTKLKLALQTSRHAGIGIDLVAMCANDVVVQGAEPLFFLDYYATGRLDLDIAAAVIDGIANGCELAGAALIGGETAELPGMYQDGDYDLAGFCVGVVEKERLIDGSRVRPGDAVLGLASSGPHANGYSLIRKVLERGASLDSAPVDALLEPTRIYVKPLLKLMEHLPVHALAHITGGGLVENIPRVLPTGASVRLQSHCWPIPAVFDWLQKTGAIAESEMYRTFNMGIGMAIILPAEREAAALDLLTAAGETAWRIGAVEAGAGGIIIQ